GDVRRHAFTGAQLVVGLPGFVEAVVRFGIDDFEVHAGNDAQTELLDPHVDDGRAPDQYGEGQAFVDDGLGGAQYAFVFAVGIDHALDGRLRLHEQRAHELAGAIHQAHQLLPVGFHILERATRHTGVHGGLSNGRRYLDDEARIKRLGNDVVRAEAQLFAGVGHGDFIIRLGLGQFGNRAHAGQLHFFVDDRRADVHGATENEREAEDVVDLVRVVGTAGGNNAVRACGLGHFRTDLGLGIGQREDQRLRRHRFHHFRRQDTGGRAAQENIGVDADIGQGASVRALSVTGLVRLHVGFAAFVDHPAGVHHVDVLALHAQVHDEVKA